MPTLTEPTSRDEILKAFAPLLRKFESEVAKVATKAEAAQEAADREVSERAAGYTVEGIIKGLAELQLSFGKAVEELSGRVEGEQVKLGELRRAIQVERRNHTKIHNTRVAADALEILKQDHARAVEGFEAEAADSRAKLDKEIADKRDEWAREAAAQEEANAEYEATLAKERKQAEEDHLYEVQRQTKIEADDQTERRRAVERELADSEAAKEKDWGAREKVLAANADEIAKLKDEVAGYDAAIEEESKKAREAAIAQVNREAKHEAELLSREVAANIEVFEIKIASLESTITEQRSEIDKLSQQLSEALAQSQKLAHRAMEGKGA
ncbi:MAG: hypothetical protein KC486_30880 [Myxococcales bacterium]|nr:hypothetical protein [Myxococcales bacterium]